MFFARDATDVITATISNITTKYILQPFKSDILTIGDSFATLAFTDALEDHLGIRPSAYNLDGVGGSTMLQQAVRHALTPLRWGDVTVMMDGGNDDTAADSISAIDSMVANLTTDRWMWVQPSPKNYLDGSPERATWDAKIAEVVAHITTTYGAEHYVECLTALKAGNDGSAQDLIDVANNIVPDSLRTDPIHENLAGTIIRTLQVMLRIIQQGW